MGVPGSLPGTDFQSEYIINGVDYTATDGRVTFSFKIPDNRGDTLSVKANAIDNAGRASEGKWLSMNVNNINDPNDNGGEQGGDPNYPFLWTWFAVAIASATILAMLAIVALPMPIPLEIRIVLAMILLAIGGILVWLAGTAKWGLL
jgi:hypothetical protein